MVKAVKLPFVTASPPSGTFRRIPEPLLASASLPRAALVLLQMSSTDDLSHAASEIWRRAASCSGLADAVTLESGTSVMTSN